MTDVNRSAAECEGAVPVTHSPPAEACSALLGPLAGQEAPARPPLLCVCRGKPPWALRGLFPERS